MTSTIVHTLQIQVGLLLRVLVGLWGHSGQGVPPMYGDFEAQRHWMEITAGLPLGDWYRHSEHNDLLYWGLDYPPLTAYVSWVFGVVARHVWPELVALRASRGHESTEGKVYMRATVILCDLIVTLPAIVICARHILGGQSQRHSHSNSHNHWTTMLSVAVLPSLLLIDHGHFQYNGVCIGLSLLAAAAISCDRDLLGSVLFCLSLNFKQMSLYYALAFFSILLRKCLTKSSLFGRFYQLAKVGSIVIATFAVLWVPFCIYPSEVTCSASLLQVLSRQFPFSRGIFEDKVANLWYALSVVYDVREVAPTAILARLSVVLTLLLCVPTMFILLRYPTRGHTFLLALVTTSLAFFLASFQVHEKSLLLSLVPAAFLISFEPLLIGWFQIFGTFTMFPLLAKDKLRIPYIACCVLYATIVCLHIYLTSKDKDRELGEASAGIPKAAARWVASLSFIGMALLHLLELFVKPPLRYPDIYPALFAIYGAMHLLLFYAVFVYWLYRAAASSGDTVATDAQPQKAKLQ